MKQRITVEQLMELSEEQKEKLRKWWEPEQGDWYYDYPSELKLVVFDCDDSWYSNEPDQDCYPILSIGQMIELINDKAGYSVIIDILEELIDKCLFNENDFCDLLWEAVKSVL